MRERTLKDHYVFISSFTSLLLGENMVELSGFMAEEVEEVLKDLHLGVDVGKKIVTADHDLDLKLSSFDVLIHHAVMEYPPEIADFFEDVVSEMDEFRKELSLFDKGGMHLILQEEAAATKGSHWIFVHKKKLTEELHQEERIIQDHLRKVKTHLQSLHQKLLNSSHFSLSLEDSSSQIHFDVEGKEEELLHILKQMLLFLTIYLHLLEEELMQFTH